MRPGTRGKKMALNKQDLINGFCKAGINKGDEIEVHSSLSSFGYVDGGKALLLGVDIYKLTAMHYAEDILPERIRKLFAPSSEIQKKYPPEEWFIEAGEPPVKPWYAIQAQAYETGLIREGYIGSCKYMCFGIWDVVGLYRQALETDPLGLYGLR